MAAAKKNPMSETRRRSRRRKPARLTAPRAVARTPWKALLRERGTIIDLMASGTSLKETLTAIARMVEKLAPPALCSVLLLQPDGKHLRHGAGPSLPEQYNQAINGLEIGPSVGSCGTAAYRKEPVIVSDIATDPLWEGPREFALSFGLRACWSMPIISQSGTVLGTIALYYRAPRQPSARDFGLLLPSAGLVRLALAQYRKEEELRAAEARSRVAADAADLGTYDIDLASKRVNWSGRFKKILGVDESYEPQLDSLQNIIHADDRARFLGGFQQWSGGVGDRETRDNEFRIVRVRDGAPRLLELRGRVLFNAQETPIRAIGVCSDITDKRAAEQRQRDTQYQIHELQKMEALGQLAGGIAHDLNNTLMPILGLSKLAMQEIAPSDPIREHLALIHRSGERARDLVSQILTFSRKEEIARAPVELAAMIEESLPLLRAAISASVTIVAHIDGNPAIWANRGQIDQVLTNLVTNAAQALGNLGGTIDIELAIDDATRMARLSIVDDGPGIDRNTMQRLFEPFFTTKRPGEGTGLGLAVAHGIVANHGGRIEVASRLGDGATFHVYLPLFKTAEAAPAPEMEHV
ncbi:MAG TPA: ATP-binding protein [Stellaceae bacterium]|jgi:PAS domain S-box-containing protein|nr:ATP-binding protein [Stellaceae bacterium]